MKKILLLFAFAGFVAVSANAQNCQHAKANAEAEASVDQPAVEAAATAAALDENIVSRTCATSGTVSYVRKVVNAETGATSFEDVEYCTNKKGFVTLASTTPAKSCTAKSADTKSCTGTAAGATDAKGPGCCTAGAAAQTGCCSGKKAATDGEAQPGRQKRGGA